MEVRGTRRTLRFGRRDEVPTLVPELSIGKHRSPKQGACFMEMASYLAGERWSDRPKCTHPLLGGLARVVNDHTTDEGRPRLIELIPSVIGLTSKDPRVDARIAWRTAVTALPIVWVERQKVMAVAVVAADRVLADLDRTGRRDLLPASRTALDRAPAAAAWAARFTGDERVPPARFRRVSAPCIVGNAVPGIAESGILDPDEVLRQLLVGAIEDVRELQEPTTEDVSAGRRRRVQHV